VNFGKKQWIELATAAVEKDAAKNRFALQHGRIDTPLTRLEFRSLLQGDLEDRDPRVLASEWQSKHPDGPARAPLK
jgi:hypothetical protein